MLKKNWTMVVMFQIVSVTIVATVHFLSADSPDKLTNLELLRLGGLILIASMPVALSGQLISLTKRHPIRYSARVISSLQIPYTLFLTTALTPVLGILIYQEKAESIRRLTQAYLESFGVLMLLSWPAGIVLALVVRNKYQPDDADEQIDSTPTTGWAYPSLE